MNLNENTISMRGTLLELQKFEGYHVMCLEQLVRKKFLTKFKIIAKGEIPEMDIGDEIIVLNALAYYNENEFRFRVEDAKNQIFRTKFVPDKGTIKADDKFI